MKSDAETRQLTTLALARANRASAALESAFMDIIETPTRLYVPANPQVTFAGDGTAFVECVMVIEP